MSNGHAMTFSAMPEHIDELGHVNNAVWVEWIQAIAIAHWTAIAPPDMQCAYVWMVTRHEIDYRSNISIGQSADGVTFIPDPPSGARFDRRTDFRDAAGRIIVAARTTWALLDRASGRPLRVRGDIVELFGPFGEG